MGQHGGVIQTVLSPVCKSFESGQGGAGLLPSPSATEASIIDSSPSASELACDDVVEPPVVFAPVSGSFEPMDFNRELSKMAQEMEDSAKKTIEAEKSGPVAGEVEVKDDALAKQCLQPSGPR